MGTKITMINVDFRDLLAIFVRKWPQFVMKLLVTMEGNVRLLVTHSDVTAHMDGQEQHVMKT